MKRRRISRSSPIHGDTTLAEQFFGHVEAPKSGVYGASLAVVSPDGSRTCGIGYPTDKTFLLGSVGKALNGLIYSDMVAAGTVHPEDTLGQFLPLAETPAVKSGEVVYLPSDETVCV
ncbi:MAG: hypothetical protein ACTIL2_14520, partial [Corynebacterium sp.]